MPPKISKQACIEHGAKGQIALAAKKAALASESAYEELLEEFKAAKLQIDTLKNELEGLQVEHSILNTNFSKLQETYATLQEPFFPL